MLILGSRDEVSACPFCGATLDILPKPDASGKPLAVQCKKCWEYSGLQQGFVSPYNANAVQKASRPTFLSPIEQTVVWPRGCVQCGATPTRFDEVGTISSNKGLLMVGVVRVNSFKLKGAPYCDAHKKSVDISYRNRQPGLLEMALPADDAAVYGSQQRPICSGEHRAKEITAMWSTTGGIR